MPFITVGSENSGPIDLYYEDHGSGQPIVLIHGYPFNGATWEKQTRPLVDAGYRVIFYDRRGFGSSAQPAFGYDYDTLAADLKMIMESLDLRDTVLVGHSMGTGEVIRYLSAYGSARVSRAVLMSPLAPFLLKTPDNPEGVDGKLFAGFKQAIAADRFAFLTTFCDQFFNYQQDRGRLVSEEAYRAHWDIGARSSAKAMLDCVDAWLTDFRPDLPRIDVPSLIVQGDADAILPFPATGQRLASMLPNSSLVTLRGGSHAIGWTRADEVNRAIIEFVGTRAMAHA